MAPHLRDQKNNRTRRQSTRAREAHRGFDPDRDRFADIAARLRWANDRDRGEPTRASPPASRARSICCRCLACT
jgi:hypothetical protein